MVGIYEEIVDEGLRLILFVSKSVTIFCGCLIRPHKFCHIFGVGNICAIYVS